MTLVCTGGHVYNTDSLYIRMSLSGRTEGDRCPMCINYDIMSSPKETKCNRKLWDIDKYAEHHFSNCLRRRISGNDPKFGSIKWQSHFGTGLIDTIKKLLLDGKILKCYYHATSIRGSHEVVIFIMN